MQMSNIMDSKNLRNRSPDLQRVRGANADHRLHHRSAWGREDPWTHRGTDLACATPDANRSRSLILRLRRYELSIPRSSLVSRPSRARLLNVERESARSAALFADSQRSQNLCRGLFQRNCTENQTKKPNTVKSNPPSHHQAPMKRLNYFLGKFWFSYTSTNMTILKEILSYSENYFKNYTIIYQYIRI